MTQILLSRAHTLGICFAFLCGVPWGDSLAAQASLLPPESDSSAPLAEAEDQAQLQPENVPQENAQNLVLERLTALQQMRLRMEQDMADYFAAARANSSYQPNLAQSGAPDIRQMRQEVNSNLQQLENRFRCLDVDLAGNNGNVVLVCGDNHGPVSSNNQQAFGADLNVTGGGL